MTPQELSFPPVISHWREHQLTTATTAALDPNRFVAISMPPGSGKSATVVAAMRIMEQVQGKVVRTVVLTSTKALQEQYLATFATMRMRDMRGRGNFPCRAVETGSPLAYLGAPGYSCAEGPCLDGNHCELKESRACDYYAHIDAAGDFVVTNYAKFLIDPLVFGDVDLLICDEAHNLVDALSHFASADISPTLWGSDTPDIGQPIDYYRTWGAAQRERTMSTLARGRLPLDAAREERRKLDNAVAAMSLPDESVLDDAGRTPRAIPLWPSSSAERVLFRNIPKVILCSGTLSERDMGRLGIEVYRWIDVPMQFEVRRRPVRYVQGLGPALSYRSSDEDYAKSAEAIKAWVTRPTALARPENALVHAHSYRLSERIEENIGPLPYMLWSHDNAEGFRDAHDAFVDHGGVFLTPTAYEGVEYPDSQCRLNIIAKIPYPSTADPLTKARMSEDSSYLADVTSARMTQMMMRGMRSESDWCETAITDAAWSRFRRRATFRPWVAESFQIFDTLPKPLRETLGQ